MEPKLSVAHELICDILGSLGQIEEAIAAVWEFRREASEQKAHGAMAVAGWVRAGADEHDRPCRRKVRGRSSALGVSPDRCTFIDKSADSLFRITCQQIFDHHS